MLNRHGRPCDVRWPARAIRHPVATGAYVGLPRKLTAIEGGIFRCSCEPESAIYRTLELHAV